MAVYTLIDAATASALAREAGLGSIRRVEPVPAGSVNSNYLLDTERGRFYLRLYETTARADVDYEIALIRHLRGHGLATPEPLGPFEAAGKPAALFLEVGGTLSCQRAVTPARARAVGAALASLHDAQRGFAIRRAGRFTLEDVARRLDGVAARAGTDLAPTVADLREELRRLSAERDPALPSGVIHGDLFRDNVLWDGDRVVALLDFESASDGPFLYDLAVALLAWSYGDEFDWTLARDMVEGYALARALSAAERAALFAEARFAAARFAVTRIDDFTLRPARGGRVEKDYRRFVARLRALRTLGPRDLRARLGLTPP